jgi:SinI restriction endonuclease
MVFNVALAREIAATYDENIIAERGLIESFTEICHFLSDEPNFLSWRGKVAPSVADKEGLKILAERYYGSYRSSNFPALPGTVPDEMVSIVMQEAYGYSIEACKQLKIDHQHSMCAENCVGALLERYLDSVLRPQGWHWCCGDFVKAIDFIRRNQDGTWLALQVKNRDNSENSSSSAIRKGTAIQKWFRTFSKKEATNWVNLPPLMQGYNLSEEEFIVFVRRYLTAERSRRNPSLAKSI